MISKSAVSETVCIFQRIYNPHVKIEISHFLLVVRWQSDATTVSVGQLDRRT